MVHVNKQGHRGCYDNAKTGKFIPIHKEKYVGNENPIFKSGLELKMMRFLDRSPNIIKWSYENLSIKYIDKSTNPPKVRTYYIDFTATVKSQNKLQRWWIEIKSSEETTEPNKKSNMKKKLTWIKNQCKWKSAKLLAESKGCVFKVITENELN